MSISFVSISFVSRPLRAPPPTPIPRSRTSKHSSHSQRGITSSSHSLISGSIPPSLHFTAPGFTQLHTNSLNPRTDDPPSPSPSPSSPPSYTNYTLSHWNLGLSPTEHNPVSRQPTQSRNRCSPRNKTPYGSFVRSRGIPTQNPSLTRATYVELCTAIRTSTPSI